MIKNNKKQFKNYFVIFWLYSELGQYGVVGVKDPKDVKVSILSKQKKM